MSDTSLLQAMLAAKAIGGGGGGFTPTTAQFTAMNSGITSTDVEQITTNKNNITGLLPMAYTSPTLVSSWNLTLVWGGYCKIGNLCLINMRINVGNEITHGEFLVRGLPTPANSSVLSNGQQFCTLTNNKKQSIAVTIDPNSTTSGYTAGIANVENSEGIATGTLTISGLYLCE